jgi:cell fate (sporulation/competence/biofilm development) regulator YlbF (YheA/YmcA/DUF963 family)
MNDNIVRPKNKKQSEELQTALQQMKVVSDTAKEDVGLLASIHEIETENTKPISELYDVKGWK